MTDYEGLLNSDGTTLVAKTEWVLVQAAYTYLITNALG